MKALCWFDAGAYGGLIDKMPMGAAFNKGLTFKMGQTHVQRYMPLLLDHISQGQIDPTFIITHRLTLEEAPKAYKIFRDKKEVYVKSHYNHKWIKIRFNCLRGAKP